MAQASINVGAPSEDAAMQLVEIMQLLGEKDTNYLRVARDALRRDKENSQKSESADPQSSIVDLEDMWSNKSEDVSTIHWVSAMGSSSKQQAPKKKKLPVPSTSAAVSCCPGLQAAYRRKKLQASSAEHKMAKPKTTGSTFSSSTGIVPPTPGRKGPRGLIGRLRRNKLPAPLPMPSTSSAVIQTDKAGNCRKGTTRGP